MNRRTLVAGVSSLLGGAGAVISSGAFSFSRADRNLNVVVQDDNAAYLKLQQLGGGGRSGEDETPEQVVFEFPGFREGRHNPNDPEGIGADSVYEFVDDAKGETEGLLEITNQGTNDVKIVTDQSATDGPQIELFDVADQDRTALRNVQRELDVGERFKAGIRIDTHGVEISGGNGTNGEYWETITLIAEATN